jgi:uncharacterized phage-associated protein
MHSFMVQNVPLRFIFDHDKTNNAMLFVCQQLGSVGKHKLMKILYFADQKHLVRYGRFITGDRYIAMEYGTVPSKSYDIVKANTQAPSLFQFIDKNTIAANYLPNIDQFSESDLECLRESIDENKNLSFSELVEKSHKQAYDKAGLNNEILIEDIAIEAGANEEMLKYIRLQLENQNNFL